MDASYLSQQVNSIIGQLHGLFDEIGVPDHDREARETELFAALSETLNNQVKAVAVEKKTMIDEAERIITSIRQMEASIDDHGSRHSYHDDDDDLEITYPLNRCLVALRERHSQVSKQHRERFEQVRKLAQALESYSSHLEPSFVKITLPPTGPHQSIPPTFDLSPSYVDKLDNEFTRVYEEYTHRIETVQALCENIIQLWAELGTPQAQTDNAIVKYYRDAPEQLGLHKDDLSRLQGKRDKLADEKKNREKRLRDLRAAVEALWEKLGVDESRRKSFLNNNRGCGVRQINEFQDELTKLNELKRQNLHLFVEDARYKLQELWDALYFSEDEMLEFTPAFSDVYSDALLEAHEREIARLDALREQRAPTLALVEKHRTLVQERDELAASSQDASRLMMRGQKGEKRDPGKLLREEKMRKRIAKELPKIAADLSKMLEKWEDEYGRPFLVHGERYLDQLELEAPKPVPGPRSKTPAGPPPSTLRNQRSGTLTRSNSAITRSESNPTLNRTASVPRSKTPTVHGSIRRAPPPAASQTMRDPRGSPTRLPARAPLSNLKFGNNSPERQRPAPERPESRTGTLRAGHPIMRAPPPKMRELLPPIEFDTPINKYRSDNNFGSSINVRAVPPEDVYDDRSHQSYGRSYLQESHASIQNKQFSQSAYPQAPPPRQVSNSSTQISGSENWETYDDNSEPELDASDAYYQKLRATKGRRFTPEDTHPAAQMKRQRGIPPAMHAGHVVDAEGNRIISGSEWTDEDAM
ncbi:microtubule associated protein-domain-containing protein [Camillea tinctor]|nr:microtubule associated protein-domain-containing protein [Camillea tinctor]